MNALKYGGQSKKLNDKKWTTKTLFSIKLYENLKRIPTAFAKFFEIISCNVGKKHSQ